MKGMFRKALALTLTGGLLTAFPLTVQAAVVVDDNGNCNLYFSTSHGVFEDNNNDIKVIRVNIDSENDVVDLDSLDLSITGENVYTFNGWEFGGEIVTSIPASELELGGNNIIYADWEEPSNTDRYYIHLDTGAGTIPGMEDHAYYVYGSQKGYMLDFPKEGFEEYVLPEPVCTIEGAEFVGWDAFYSTYSGQLESRTSIGPDDYYSDLYHVTAAYRKEAGSEDTENLMVFHSEGGTLEGKETATYVACIESDSDYQVLDIFIPEKEGYQFVGWFTEPNGQGDRIYNVTTYYFSRYTDDSGKLNLYAFWERVPVQPATDSAQDHQVAQYLVNNLEQYESGGWGYFADHPEAVEAIRTANSNDQPVTVEVAVVRDERPQAAENAARFIQNTYTESTLFSEEYYWVYVSLKVDGQEVCQLPLPSELDSLEVRLPIPQDIPPAPVHQRLEYQVRGLQNDNDDYSSFSTTERDGYLDVQFGYDLETTDSLLISGYYTGTHDVSFSYANDHMNKSIYFASEDEAIPITEIEPEGAREDYHWMKFLNWFYYDQKDGSKHYVTELTQDCFSDDRNFLFLQAEYDETMPKDSGTYHILLTGLPPVEGLEGFTKEYGFSHFNYYGQFSVEDFQPIELPQIVGLREGWQFVGWNLRYDPERGEVTSWNHGRITAEDFKDDDVLTLNACYISPATDDELTYCMIMDANGGLLNGEPIGKYHSAAWDSGTDYMFGDILVPERKGYRFAGWNTKKDGTGDTLSGTGCGSVTIFAKYHNPVYCDDQNNVYLYAQWERTEEELVNLSTVSAQEINLGGSIIVSGSAEKGTAPYTFEYYYKKSTSAAWQKLNSTSDGTQAVYTPATAASYKLRVIAKDADGCKAEKQFDIIVKKALTNQASVSATTIPKDTTVTVTGAASGGAGGYLYAFYYKKSTSAAWTSLGEIYKNTKQVSFIPAVVATYLVKVNVKDASGKVETRQFTVNSVKPSAGDLVNKSALSATEVVRGTPITITGTATGGSDGYKYAFYYKKSTSKAFTAIGTEYGSATSAVFTPASAAEYQVRIYVKDSSGTIVAKQYKITAAATKPLVNESTVSSESVKPGTAVVIRGAASGGSGSYTYTYSYRKTTSKYKTVLTPAGDEESVTFTPAVKAEYEVTVTASDSKGASAVKTFIIQSA